MQIEDQKSLVSVVSLSDIVWRTIFFVSLLLALFYIGLNFPI